MGGFGTQCSRSSQLRDPRYLRFWKRDRLVIAQTEDLHEPGSWITFTSCQPKGLQKGKWSTYPCECSTSHGNPFYVARYVAICCDWLIGYTFFSFPCFYVGHVLVTVATVATMAAAARSPGPALVRSSSAWQRSSQS